MNNITYDKIYIQCTDKSHMHPTKLKNVCRHDNVPIPNGKHWGSQQRQNRHQDDPR